MRTDTINELLPTMALIGAVFERAVMDLQSANVHALDALAFLRDPTAAENLTKLTGGDAVNYQRRLRLCLADIGREMRSDEIDTVGEG